ncbi:MAG: hypothetical protein C5B52_17325 [Bacteroidetes bacterium]|nr:MAG: hypothetical protein C5B52_17325 [Bacteroidota bacterium]
MKNNQFEIWREAHDEAYSDEQKEIASLTRSLTVIKHEVELFLILLRRVGENPKSYSFCDPIAALIALLECERNMSPYFAAGLHGVPIEFVLEIFKYRKRLSNRDLREIAVDLQARADDYDERKRYAQIVKSVRARKKREWKNRKRNDELIVG